MRPNLTRVCALVIMLGFAGCGEGEPEIPADYGEQSLTAKEKPGKKGPPPVPKGMEPAESRSERPAP